jgi:hypothetical protein
LKDQYGCSSLFLESPKEPIDMKIGIVRDWYRDKGELSDGKIKR